MATWTAIGIDSYRRLLDGHMGRNRYRQLQETLRWPHSYITLISRKIIYIHTYNLYWSQYRPVHDINVYQYGYTIKENSCIYDKYHGSIMI